MMQVTDIRRWSLRARLTAYVCLSTTAVLCVVGWVLYRQLTYQLWEKDETVVRSAVDRQRALLADIDAEGGLGRWQSEWAYAKQRRRLALRLTSPAGEVNETEPNLAIPASAYPRPRAHGPLAHYAMARDGHQVRYMLDTLTVETGPGQRWLLQVAYDVSESDDLIAGFGRQLLLVVMAAVATASALGAWLVHRGLRPLRAMSDAISGITAHKLDSRIADKAWPNDLRQLAESFDEMLQGLQAAFDQLSRFSSDLAHEFRSPIANLVSAASVMLSRQRSPEEYQDTLAVVVEEGERLSRMVSSMLFLARADNAQQALNIERLSVSDQMRKVAEAYGPVADERNVHFEVDGAGEVDADPLLLRSAVSNLVANALRHTSSGGTVLLSAKAHDGGVQFCVLDTGGGIAAEHLPHLFERFYRIDAARSDGDRTGLGLAVVRSIVELHGGRVDVQSTPGRGSCFFLWFPCGDRP